MSTASRATATAEWRANIPRELRDRRQWVNYRREVRDGKPTKVPYDPRTGRRAESDNPATWATFDEVVGALELGGRYDGVGFVFSEDDPYVGVDLDHCRDPETGAVEPWALGIVRRLDSYTEVSPSGTGLHIIVKGRLPPGRRRKGQIEMYSEGRFFTMSGALFEVQP